MTKKVEVRITSETIGGLDPSSMERVYAVVVNGCVISHYVRRSEIVCLANAIFEAVQVVLFETDTVTARWDDEAMELLQEVYTEQKEIWNN